MKEGCTVRGKSGFYPRDASLGSQPCLVHLLQGKDPLWDRRKSGCGKKGTLEVVTVLGGPREAGLASAKATWRRSKRPFREQVRELAPSGPVCEAIIVWETLIP